MRETAPEEILMASPRLAPHAHRLVWTPIRDDAWGAASTVEAPQKHLMP